MLGVVPCHVMSCQILCIWSCLNGKIIRKVFKIEKINRVQFCCSSCVKESHKNLGSAFSRKASASGMWCLVIWYKFADISKEHTVRHCLKDWRVQPRKQNANPLLLLQEASNSAVLGSAYQAKYGLVYSDTSFAEITQNLPPPILACEPSKDADEVWCKAIGHNLKQQRVDRSSGWHIAMKHGSHSSNMIATFWDATPYSLVYRYHHFGGTCCLCLQGSEEWFGYRAQWVRPAAAH
jgi:hypothetical protein